METSLSQRALAWTKNTSKGVKSFFSTTGQATKRNVIFSQLSVAARERSLCNGFLVPDLVNGASSSRLVPRTCLTEAYELRTNCRICCHFQAGRFKSSKSIQYVPRGCTAESRDLHGSHDDVAATAVELAATMLAEKTGEDFDSIKPRLQAVQVVKRRAHKGLPKVYVATIAGVGPVYY